MLRAKLRTGTATRGSRPYATAAPLPAAILGVHDTPPELNISAPGDNPVSWVIESSTDEITFTDLATIDGSADTWAISDTNLYYRVRGVDAQGVTVIGESNSVLMSRDS